MIPILIMKTCNRCKDTCQILKDKIMKDSELKSVFNDRIFDSIREETEVQNRPFILYTEWLANNNEQQYHRNCPLIFDFDLVIYMPRWKVKEWRYWREKIKQILIHSCPEKDIRFDRYWAWVPYQTGCRFMHPIQWKYTQYQCTKHCETF